VKEILLIGGFVLMKMIYDLLNMVMIERGIVTNNLPKRGHVNGLKLQIYDVWRVERFFH